MQRMSVSTALDETSAAAWPQVADATRVKMMAVQTTTMRGVLEKFVVELFGHHMAVIIRQVVLREVCSKLDPSAVAFLPEKREVNGTISLGLRGFGKMATPANCADFSGNGRCDHALVSADTFMVQEDVEPSKSETGNLIILDGVVFDAWTAPLLDETPEAARVIGTGAVKKVTVGNESTSNDSSPEKGSTDETNGTADWVLTAAKGKEQDDDDDDDDDDNDDDDYEEEEEDDNDDKLEPGDDEEDVEGEDEEGEEAGEEDAEDDGEAEDNGEKDDGEEEGEEEDDVEGEGEEEDDVEGEEDGDEEADEEQEDDEEDGEEEDPEDEDEDEVDGESEEDIEDLEPPKKKRK